MINWILNLIGITIYFIGRYSKRATKTARFNHKFWLSDNWPELTSTLLINVALMILLMQPETQVNLDSLIKEYVPFGLDIAVKPLMSFLLGVIFSAAFYKLYRSKTKR
jgi:uncharacterized integral membrane protein